MVDKLLAELLSEVRKMRADLDAIKKDVKQITTNKTPESKPGK